MIPRLVLASKNPDKLAEMASVIAETGLAGEIVQGLDWPDVEETGDTLEENALLKARAVAEATGLPAVADDTGLEVDALGGAPGVRTARFAGPDATYADNIRHLIAQMNGVADRRAVFRSAVALVFPDGAELTAHGELHGEIGLEARGADGFGYDPVFMVESRSLAEMGFTEKNRMSHRARALRALAASMGL